MSVKSYHKMVMMIQHLLLWIPGVDGVCGQSVVGLVGVVGNQEKEIVLLIIKQN